MEAQPAAVLDTIRDACAAGDHEAVTLALAGIEDDALTKRAITEILRQTEGTEWYARYLFPALDWLLSLPVPELSTAATMLHRAHQLGVDDLATSRLVYQHLIGPDEEGARQRFERNLALVGGYFAYAPLEVLEFHRAKIRACVLPLPVDESLETRPSAGREPATMLVDAPGLGALLSAVRDHECVYAVYDDLAPLVAMLLFADLTPLRPALLERRLVFLAGRDDGALASFFDEPSRSVGRYFPASVDDWSGSGHYAALVQSLREEHVVRFARDHRDIVARYAGADREYYRRLLAQPPPATRVLLIGSQDLGSLNPNDNVLANWHRALTTLGYTTRLLGQAQLPFDRLTKTAVHRQLAEFRPDVVFTINRAVGELLGELPGDDLVRANLLWLMRFRDPSRLEVDGLPYDHNMFVSALLVRYGEAARRAGMPADRVTVLPDGVDTDRFQPRPRDDAARFACDVASATNAPGDEPVLRAGVLRLVDQHATGGERGPAEWAELRRAIEALCDELEAVGTSERPYYHESSVDWLFGQHLRRAGLELAPGERRVLVGQANSYLNAFIRRQTVEWVIRSGITRSIKLWGRGWHNVTHLRPFAMGTARHGEDLSAAYQYAKVTISDQPAFSLHERNFEVLASGGFPLVRRGARPEIPAAVTPAELTAPSPDEITRYMVEDEDVVLFTDRDEFLSKLAHYLERPAERAAIAARGRQRVIEELSTVALARHTMGFLGAYYQS